MKNESFYSSVADVVRSGRKLKGYTQQELASILRITQGYLSKIESGLLDPNFSLILNYCQVTGVNIDSFNHGYITKKILDNENSSSGVKRSFRPSSREHISSQGVKVRFLIPIIRFAVARLGRNRMEQICKSLKVDPDILLCHDLEVNIGFIFALAQIVQSEIGVRPAMSELFLFSQQEMRGQCGQMLSEANSDGASPLNCVRKFITYQNSFFSGIVFRIEEDHNDYVDVALTMDLPLAERKSFNKSADIREFFEQYTIGFFEFMGMEENNSKSRFDVAKLSGFSEGEYKFRISLRRDF